MSTTNHYDRYVAAQSVAATGVSVTATRTVLSSSEIPVFQQPLVTTLLEDKLIDAAQPVPPALPRTRPIPKSLFLASDDDDNDIGNDLAFLLVLHAGYVDYEIDFTLSFGQAKINVYSFSHQGKFDHGSFDTFPENTPISSMRAEHYLLAPFRSG